MSDALKGLSNDILSWKNKYKDIYYVKIEDNKYIFRLLTRGEYHNIFSAQQYLDRNVEDILLEKCIIYRSGSLDNALAGEIDYIIKLILEFSGFSKKEELLKDIENERNNINTVDKQITLIICKAFPHLTPDDINKLTYPKLLEYLTLAESILDIKLKIDQEEQPNKIDFDQENKKILGVKPNNFKNQQRGDVPRNLG